MTSDIELLLETMSDLSDDELKHFRRILKNHRPVATLHAATPQRQLMMVDMQDTVFLTVQTFNQQSLEKTKNILSEMKRTDLVQRLSNNSSGTKSK